MQPQSYEAQIATMSIHNGSPTINEHCRKQLMLAAAVGEFADRELSAAYETINNLKDALGRAGRKGTN